jgi:hypothetical protein
MGYQMVTSTQKSSPKEIVIISHSPIFYWWPVWFVGFLLAVLTYFDGHLMAIVPVGTVAERARTVSGHPDSRDILVLPPDAQLPVAAETGAVLQPRLRMASSNSLGIIFVTTLCLVIVITNIHVRGLWSVLVILGIVSATILIALLKWWDPILRTVGVIDIHINALGYFSIGLFLFVIWALIVLVYDRQLYMIFSRGQLRVRTAIGAGEQTYDTFGIKLEKHMDDLFRHWLLGFGSGDMTVRTGGTNAQQFQVANVLRIGKKLKLIQQMLQERAVVGGAP